MNITSDQISAAGQRQYNEDFVCTFVHNDSRCFVLCDGLGGHFGGKEAARCVGEAVGRTFLLSEQEPLSEAMERALLQAQSELNQRQSACGAGSGMKTTLCCLMIRGTEAVAAFVGDSRIYQFRNARITGRTLDHSVAQALVRAQELTEADIRHHEDRSKLLRAMGDDWDEPQYEIWQDILPVLPGDAFLLCSDGFWEWIEEADMERMLAQSGDPERWLVEMEQWILRCGQGSDMDNYSAIAVMLA